MFDLAASPLPSTVANSPLVPVAPRPASVTAAHASPEIAAATGDASQVGAFEALLALQSAPAIVPPPALPVQPIRQHSGKIVPEAANAVAAEAAEDTSAPNDHIAEVDAFAPVTPLQSVASPVTPDLASIAAIFAAPQRLDPTPAIAPIAKRQAEALVTPSGVAPSPLAIPSAAAIVLAHTAKIELEPTSPPSLRTAPEAVVGNDAEAPQAIAPALVATASQTSPLRTNATRPPTPAQASATVARTARPIAQSDDAPVSPQPMQARSLSTLGPDADQVPTAEMATEVASLPVHTAHPAPIHQHAAPETRAGPRAERVDFATLVETLSRAREDASPHAVRASVQHADFGRVSLRFERDDTGALTVAMNSSDPGFARAVTASNEVASTQTQADSQRGQASQNAPFSQGDSPRQQPGSRQSQPTLQAGDTQRPDEPKPDSNGIFA